MEVPGSIITRAVTLLALVTLIGVESKLLPSFITPCSRSSPTFNKCLYNTAQVVASVFSKGIPSLDVPALDPVSLKKISINAPGLKIVFDKVILTGLAGSTINEFKMDFEKKQGLTDITVNLTMKGNYKVDGRVLILPIRGDGPFSVLLKNMNLGIRYGIDTVVGADGKDHIAIALTKRTYKVERAHFDLQNLFNGNAFLAEPTLQFLNENWQLIMNDIAPPAVDQIIGACMRVTNSFYTAVPLEELLAP